MKATREMINIPSGHSFRVIRWDKNLEEVESVRADGVVEKVTGEGTRWHFHVEMELTLFVSGSELDFSDDLQQGGFKVSNPNAVVTCSCGESFAA